MPLQITQPRQKTRFSEALGNVANAYSQYSQQPSLAGQQKTASKMGIDPDALRSLDPKTRNQILAEGLRRNIDVTQAAKTGGINLQQPQNQPQENRQQGRGQQFLQDEGQRQQFNAPGFMEEQGKPSRGPGKPATSMMPQTATTGQKVPVLDPQGVIAEGKRIQQESLSANHPMDQYTAWQLAQQQNEANKAHNSGVEGEQETARISQRDYGASGEKALLNVFPEATDEQKAIFQRKGTEAAEKYKKESEINRELALEAKKFKNTMANVKASIGPKRLTSTEKILGRGREADAVKTSFRNKLKPLLDEGLYDTARNLLSQLGYHPEERETILSDMSEGAKKALVEMPNMTREKKAGEVSFTKGYPERAPADLNPLNNSQKSILRNNLSNVFQNDPSANLVLLRKQYEDKGVDWREFSEALNEMIYEGKVKLNPDQFEMLVHIDEPPLNDLEKILHGAKLIGR